MRKNYSIVVYKKSFVLSLILALFCTVNSKAQTTLATVPNPPFDASNGAGANTAVTFVLENTNSFPILLTNVATWLNTADANATLQLWYSATSLGGQPTIATPTWTQIAQVTGFAAPTTNGITPVWSNLGFVIPGNTQYRFAVWYVNIGSHYSGAAGAPVAINTFSGGGVVMKLGDIQIGGGNVGWGGANEPRWFTGSVTFQPFGPCTTPPVAGTINSNNNPVCPNASFVLGLTGGTGGQGQTYQWQSSSLGTGPWTNVPGGTTATLNASQTSATYYRVYTTCGSATDTAAPIFINMAAPTACLNYCPSIPTNTADEEIFSVTVNGQTNTWPCNTVAPGPGSVLNRYSNFYPLGALTDLIPGTTVQFTILEDECDGATYFNNGCAVWVDFNRNGSFADPGERVYFETALTISPRTITGSFVVPITATAGITGMRIIVAEGQSGDNLQPCMSYGFGETEDYIVNIIPAVNCAGTPTGGNAVSSKTFVCAYENFSLSLTGATLGLGLSYQWQSSPDSAAWTNIPGATTSVYNTSQTATSYYRCRVTCANGGAFAFSAGVKVVSPLLVSGTFVIDNGGTGDFTTFGQAISYISCGINGPVTFNVKQGSGPYAEQVTISQIPGASDVNTVTINGNLATLSFPGTTGSRSGILLNGADHITIDSLILTATGSFGWGITLTNRADSNTVSNCVINVSATNSTSVDHAGIVISGSITSPTTSGNNGHYNLFTNNITNGGYYGIVIYGNSATGQQNLSNVVSNNKINNTYSYGIYSAYQKDALISANEITRPTRTNSTTTAGVFLTTGSVNCLVERNRVHHMFGALATSTSTVYGIYVGADATAGMENKIYNNLVYSLGGNGTQYGLYNTSGDNMQAYHNTVSLDDAQGTSGAAHGIYQTTAATGLDYKNNIVLISRTGTGAKRCIFFNTTTSTIASNNNVLYMNAPAGSDNVVGQYGTTSYTTLSNWQTANSSAYDQQSVGDDPVFANPVTGDYMPASIAVDNIGVPLITTDINNALRDLATPDPGAFEFAIAPGINMGVQSLITPAAAANGCYTNAENVTVKLRNWSSTPINFATNPVTVTVNITGAVTQTLTTIVNSGVLASSDTLYVSLPTTLDMSTTGTYTINAFTTVTGDVNPANNGMVAVTRTKVALTPGTITVTPSSYCVIPGVPTLSATGGTGVGYYQWQESQTSNSGFGDISGATTSPFTLGTPVSQTTYYRLVAGCGAATVASAQDTVTFVNPQITGVIQDIRCGAGTLTLQANATPGTIIKWYQNPTGGNAIATGSTYTTPSISATTSYYVAASTGTGGTDSVAVPLSQGTTTPVYHHMFMVRSTTGIIMTGLGLKVNNTVGTLTSWDIYYRPDDYQQITGANTSSNGWTLLTSVTNVPSLGTTTYTTLAFGLSVIIPPGATYSFYIAPVGSAGHQYGTAARGSTVVSNANASIIAGNRGSSLFNCSTSGGNPVCKIYYATDCFSDRVQVDAIISDSTRVTTDPANQAVCLGNNATFNVTSTGASLSYQWRKGGIDIPGATSSSLTIAGVTAADLGNYDVIVTGVCGPDTSAAAALTLTPAPAINTQPTPQSACAGGSATFTVAATGSGALTYKWRKNGVVIPGATSSSFTISGITAADLANYDVVVLGSCDSTISNAVALSFNAQTAVGTQPTAQSACVGSSATFTVAGTGTGTLSYQWRKGGAAINGATSSSYTINNVTAADAGNYSVIITGDCGAATSASVALTIKAATVINAQPVAQTVCGGGSATFAVTAGGTNLTYQWRKDGVNINGATAANYTVTGITTGSAGNYDVIVTGECGSPDTSDVVTLSVPPAGTWIGTTSSNWNTSTNWCGGIPTATTDIVIPSTAPNMPILSNGNGSARSITILSGGSVTVGSAGVLELYGNISGGGSFTPTLGSIVFRGTAAQSVPGFTATNVTMNGTGGVTLGGNTSVTSSLTLNNGNITLGNNNLTLAMTSTGSAASHIITSGNGNVVVANLIDGQTRTVPVGNDAASYNPVVLAANPGHITDNFTVKVQQGVFTNGISGNTYTTHVADRLWTINEATPGGSDVNVTLQWAGSQELTSFDRLGSYIIQHNGTDWVEGTTAAAVGSDPYTQIVRNVTTFSVFAVESPRLPTPTTGIYPNPTPGNLNVVTRLRNAGSVMFTVYDIKGKLVHQQSESLRTGLSQTTLELYHLPAGLYLLKVSLPNDREFMVQRFVKTN